MPFHCLIQRIDGRQTSKRRTVIQNSCWDVFLAAIHWLNMILVKKLAMMKMFIVALNVMLLLKWDLVGIGTGMATMAVVVMAKRNCAAVNNRKETSQVKDQTDSPTSKEEQKHMCNSKSCTETEQHNEEGIGTTMTSKIATAQ